MYQYRNYWYHDRRIFITRVPMHGKTIYIKRFRSMVKFLLRLYVVFRLVFNSSRTCWISFLIPVNTNHFGLDLMGLVINQTLGSGVGVTKAPFVKFSVSKIFNLAKIHVRFFESHSYLTGVTAAELREHLQSINLIFNSQRVFWQCWKKSENNGTEEFGLVTYTPGLMP